MPEFKLNRNYVFSSKFGHVINFIKGEPTYVPPILVKDVVAIGAECLDGEVDVLGEESLPVQLSYDEVRAKLFEVFKTMVVKNDPEDFTAQGVPKVGVIETRLGLKFTKSELISAWQAFRSGEENEE